MKPLVSIITPVYNGEDTISYTIESVLNQSFKDFEMIIVDDISTDSTKKIVEKYVNQDKRIKYFKLPEKGGASVARNFAISKASGRYIAFLDGDDLWSPEKLEKQIKFMQENDIGFSYTDYSYINEKGEDLNIYRKCPKKMSYFRMLLGDSVGCLTVIYDSYQTGIINIPFLKKRNDYALWCVILKKVKKGYKFNEMLAKYRKSNDSKSLSSGSKIKLLKYHYQLHRKINKFSPFKSAFYTLTNGINYLINAKFREKKNKLKYKIGIIGHFAIGKNLTDGQTVKTLNLFNTLNDLYNYKILTCDTYNWKKNPLKLIINCIKIINQCENVIFMPAKNGVKLFVPMLTGLNKRKNRNLIYVVIGGWLPMILKKRKSLCKKCKNINVILVETQGMKKDLLNLGLKNTDILLNFKNISIISKNEISCKEKKSYNLCTFSRVMFEKGISDAIIAVSDANKIIGEEFFHLDIYGPINDNYKNKFESDLNNNASSVYKGIVAADKSVETIKKYDVLLFPTRFDTEGLPGTIIDAFSSGVPVIYSNWKYSNEFFENLYNGIQFEIRNIESLTKVLINLYRKKYDIKSIKINCLETAEKYTPSVAVKSLIKYLR